MVQKETKDSIGVLAHDWLLDQYCHSWQIMYTVCATSVSFETSQLIHVCKEPSGSQVEDDMKKECIINHKTIFPLLLS